MSPRTHLLVATAAACLSIACGKDGDAKADAGTDKAATEEEKKKNADKLNDRCDNLGKVCGEKDKHKQTITEECRAAAKEQVEKGCTDKAIAAYDCYEKHVCVKGNRIWALDDFRVLTSRHKKCVDESKASGDCVAASDKDKK